MKFFCEYCGNRIDAEKDEKCPHCLASYRQNKSFKKLQEQNNKETEINNENKQKLIKHVFCIFSFSKFLFIIPIIVFLIIISIFLTVFVKFGNNFDLKSGTFDNNVENIEANFNEFAKIEEYGFKVTRYEIVENIFDQPEEGYEYVKFYFTVENLSNKELTKEDVYCIVDGISQTNDFTSGYSDLPMFIAKDLIVTGTSTFIVPKDAVGYDIRYGDYITIHIEK